MGVTYIMIQYALINTWGMFKLYQGQSSGSIGDTVAATMFETMWNETTSTIAAMAFAYAILYTNKPSWEDAQLNAIKEAATPEENKEERGPDAEQGDLTELMVNF